jgi:hypothetical protein
MAKHVVVLAVHGMGNTKRDFADELREGLAKRLGHAWSDVYFASIFYQDVLQPHQRRLMTAMKRRDIDWIKLREFMLYGFSDAAGLERRASEEDSPYHETQKRIRATLDKAYEFVGGSVPVVLVAQSLGGQVISNYLWDAQKPQASQGTWKWDGKDPEPKKDAFLRLKSLRYFYTTGCNIPIFVAGFPKDEIKAVKTAAGGYAFHWKNIYDPDDVLGWPLQTLSPSYRQAVTRDLAVNASRSLLGTIGQSWNPFSHGAYWEDRDVLKPLATDIHGLL